VAWPAGMEAIFIEGNTITSLPESLKALASLKRLNLGQLKLDDASVALADTLKAAIMTQPGGIYWSPSGEKCDAPAAK